MVGSTKSDAHKVKYCTVERSIFKTQESEGLIGCEVVRERFVRLGVHFNAY